MRQVFYQKMRQVFYQKIRRFYYKMQTVITNCDNFITKCDVCYKLRQYNLHSQGNCQQDQSRKTNEIYEQSIYVILLRTRLSISSKTTLVKESYTFGLSFLNTSQCYKSLIHKRRRGVVVITTAQLHSTKSELRFCAGSNPARGVSEIRDGENL